MALMSLFSDPFTPNYRWISPRSYYDPLRDVNRMLNIADAMMHRMDQHLGQLDVTEDGKFQYGFKIDGFHPEELKVQGVSAQYADFKNSYLHEFK